MSEKHDWSKILLDIQLRDIPIKDAPHLLFQCILDLQKSQDKLRSLTADITLTINSLKTTVEHIRENDDHNESLEPR